MGELPHALILAGGLGTRLKRVIGDRPKALAEAAGISFLDIQLKWLARQGIREVVMLTGFRGQQIVSHVGDGANWNMSLQFVQEGQALGTGGAVLNAVEELQLKQAFLLLNGDSLTEVDLSDLCRQGHDSCLAQLVVVHRENTSRYGVVEFNDRHHLLGFREKEDSCVPGWINTGIYYFPAGWFDNTTAKLFPLSLELDLIPEWISGDRAMQVFPVHGDFVDIGTPESLSRFQERSKFGP